MASVVSKPRGDRSMNERTDHDLMTSGGGTPWEDRGSTGLLSAYFATVKKAMLAPAALLREIRRPNTAGDATSFAFICGLMWSLGELVHTGILARWAPAVDTAASPWLRGVIIALVAPFATVLIARLAAIVFRKLVSSELRQSDAPTVLLFNLFSYCLAPSILAILPVVGPPLAGVWIFVLMLIAALKRLRLKVGGAIINVILTSIVCGLCGAAVMFGVNFLSGFLWQAYNG